MIERARHRMLPSVSTNEALDPGKARCALFKPEIARVSTENFEVYGVRKVWRQFRLKGVDIARCTV